MTWEVDPAKAIKGRCVVMTTPQFWAQRPAQCSRKGTVERDGKLYCKQHDPEAVRAKDKSRQEQWDKKSAREHETWRRESRYPEAIRLLRLAYDPGSPHRSPNEEIDAFLKEEPTNA